jgi:hypothetical protein
VVSIFHPTVNNPVAVVPTHIVILYCGLAAVSKYIVIKSNLAAVFESERTANTNPVLS